MTRDDVTKLWFVMKRWAEGDFLEFRKKGSIEWTRVSDDADVQFMTDSYEYRTQHGLD